MTLDQPAPQSELVKLRRDIEEGMLRERHRLRSRLRRLGRKASRSDLTRLREEVDLSRAKVDERRENLPTPKYPEELPVSERRDEIAEAIRKHPVVIVAGETGSGKTTQLPKICLGLGRGVRGMIGCTQPRRIAAIGVASRVAEELDTPLGHAVGYQIRFDARVQDETYIKFMTDGILLAESRADRFLEAYDTLIIDEAHERSLNIDFLLGRLQKLIRKRPDLKVVISSATLDVDRFSEFFGGAPVVSVQGRTYPVEVRHRPLEDEDADLAVAVGHALDEVIKENETGDVLVFLPGERDIRETMDHLDRKRLRKLEIVPLFGRLGASEQARIFRPGDARRVVVATNVAETSLTVPRIRAVIDAGLARVRRYNHRTQVEHLQVEGISQASAEQRKGRCGRIGPGLCVRLYAEEDLASRDAYTDPEILRSSLASVILQMADLGLGNVESFPFIDPPSPALIRTGYDELFEIGALDEKKRLTAEGRRMARLPIEPRYARMLLAARREEVLPEVLTIVAGLSIMDPRERPVEKRAEADAAHAKFKDDRSDFLSLLHVWREFQRQRKELPSGNQLRRWCKTTFLSYRRMREWMDVRRQLADLMEEKPGGKRDVGELFEPIHRALLAGLLGRIGKRTEDGDYRGAREVRFVIWPGSGIKNKPPAWLVASELVETSRLFGRCVAAIDPVWVEKVAGRLCKRTHLQPWWDEERGVTRAYEQVSLFGLPLVERRRVHYGPIHPAKSRELMIRDGLVRGAFRTSERFLGHNLELVDSIEAMEHKTRRSDLLVDEESLVRFYDKRIPEEIHTAKALERWVREQKKEQPDILQMREEDVALEDARGLSTDLFPEHLQVADARFDLTYRFDPGHEEDGVSCMVPVGVLPHVPPEPFTWLVPGLLADAVSELLRSLPRRYRRDINPIPQTAEACVGRLLAEDDVREVEGGVHAPPARTLAASLREALLAETGLRVEVSDFKPEALPSHLRIRFEIVDESGKTLAAGRDLNELRDGHSFRAKQQFARSPKTKHEQDGLTAWTVGRLPERIDLSDGGGSVWGYPALVDETESVALRIFDTPEKAATEHRAGLLRLALIGMASQAKNIARGLPIGQEAELIYAALGGSADDLRADILWCALNHVMLSGRDLPRAEASFQARVDGARAELYGAAHELGRIASNILMDTHTLANMLRENWPPLMQPAVKDVRGQMDAMVYAGFLRATPYEVALEIPRYIAAAGMRLNRVRQKPTKDADRMAELTPHLQRWQEARNALSGPPSAALVQYRWLLEEFRVSLFAQEIGTKEKVSAKRLHDAWVACQA